MPSLLTRERSGLPSVTTVPHPGPEAEGQSVRELLSMLRRRVGLILTVALLGSGLATLIGVSVTPHYQASSAVVIDPRAGELAGVTVDGDAGLDHADAAMIETEIEILTSRSHLEKVMDELGLFDDPYFQPPFGVVGKTVAMARQAVGHVPDTWLVAVGLAADRPDRRTPSMPPERQRKAAIDKFRQQLKILQSGQSRVIHISFTAPDPDQAALITNVLTDRYTETRLGRREADAEHTVAWLGERLERLRQRVRESEKQAADFRAEHGLFDRSQENEQKVGDLNHQLLEIRAEQVTEQARLRRARTLRAERQEFDALAEVLNSPRIADLRSEEAALIREQAELAQTYGDRHPKMINLRAELADLRARIRDETDRSIVNLQDQLSMLAAREELLKSDLQETRQTQALDQTNAIRLDELEREAESDRRHYETLLRQFKEAEEKQGAMLPDTRVITPAAPPIQPITPGPPVFGMIGFTVSTLLGSFLALLLERLNRRVKSALDVERMLGLTVLGLTPRIAKRGAKRPDRYIADKPMSVYAESVRSILMAMRLSQQSGAVGRTLVVTSALPEEGKTTLSISLAAAAATAGFKVLLIDVDLRRPALDKRLTGGRRTVGLVEHLTKGVPLEEVIQRDPDSDLQYIVAGRPPDRPLTLLQGAEFRHLIETVRRDYDHVILDNAPLLAVADARLVCRFADQVILAVRWGRTEIDALGHAAQTLMQTQTELAGCALTAVDMRKYRLYGRDAGSYYGSYRHYYAN